MTDTNAMGKLVPGFEFLQSLVKGASAAMPQVGQWVAPTLDPADLDKRIDELRTVQFWLEQNARMLAATIQALEVQRMTLSTLQTMNVSFSDLTESLKIRLPEAPPPASAAAPAARAAPTPPPAPARPAEPPAAAATPQARAGVIDPMQWWGALTQQFTELAANALKDGGAGAVRSFAGAMATPDTATAGKTSTSVAADKPAPAAKTGTKAAKPDAGTAAKKTASRRAGASPRG